MGLTVDSHLKYGKKIISNVHFLTLPYVQYSLEWFVSEIVNSGTEMEDAAMLLDETYQAMDARSSGTKTNKILSYFVYQTRKRDVDLFICTHDIMNIDLRLRKAIDVRGSCSCVYERPCKQCHGSGKMPDGSVCDRCLGCFDPDSLRPHVTPYTYVGFERVYFLRVKRTKINMPRRFTWDFVANKYWVLFDTKQRVGVQAKVFQGIDTAEIF